MQNELPKTYDALKIEKGVRERWDNEKFYNPDNLPNRHKTPFTVMMPPPNVTGSLHMGHALEASLTDCLVRWKRMRGFKTLWLPGLDHASIAVHNVIDKQLKKEGKTRFNLGREEFLKRAWEWKEKYGGIILEQLKRLGASADWSKTRFTMDEEYTKAVEKVFTHYLDKGWIYRGERVINWCIHCGTPVSDLELEYVEEKGELWYIRYPIRENGKIQNPNVKYVIVATTRPETMLGDTAVAVNPQDNRYKTFVGKTVILPLVNREIPVIQDNAVDKNFGTGAVKVTPAHDLTDAEIGKRHNLALVAVIGQNGRITDNAPKKYRGMKTKEAREAIVRDLNEQNAIEKIEDYTHNIALCQRSGTIIEPLPSKQWFLKMSELTKLAIKAYEKNAVCVSPERFKRIALERLANERDWCISRQLWWGHKIPIQGEDDILDTWFSSALWPFAALGWPKQTKDFKTFYPTQWITSARDIIFLWDNKMIFSGIEFTGKTPFKDLYIHPTVLTKDGKRMSKSLGTGIDPLELIERYGADAVRFGLLWQLTGNQDTRFDESAILAGKKFLNKLWNASRYILSRAENENVPEQLPPSNEPIIKTLISAINKTEENLNELKFGQALENFYEFFWHTFCDKYLEESKQLNDEKTRQLLLFVLAQSLKTLHPFVPFITDELWRKLPHKTLTPITVETWPAFTPLRGAAANKPKSNKSNSQTTKKAS